ncbi:MAG: choice-of-anchor Q domain-containing protein, partial [Acidimicrobiales bacterium]
MRRFFVVLAAVAMGVATCAVGVPAAAAADGSVSGTVSDSGHVGIGGITVNVRHWYFGVVVASGTTAGDGTYAVPVAPGSYRIEFVDPGDVYAPRMAGGTDGVPTWVASEIVEVPDGGAAVRDVTMLEKYASFSGTITGPGSVPLSGMAVEARDALGTVVASTGTSGDGTYVLAVPAPASVRVYVRDPGLIYGPLYHPGVITKTESTTFALTAGDAVVADVTLPVGGSLQGQVRVGPHPQHQMIAAVLEASTGELITGALSDVAGGYRIDALAPGDYKVGLIDPTYLIGDPAIALRPVLVPDQDLGVAGLEAALAASTPFTVSSGGVADVGTQTMVGADCHPAVLGPGVELPGADLSGKHLEGCPLGGSDLTGADLSGAHLTYADVAGADLRSADLTGADLTGATGVPATDQATTFATTTCPNGTAASPSCEEWAQTLTVTNGEDVRDDDPGDGVCQDVGGGPGDCSLRAAIDEANASSTTDTITVDATVGTVTLARAGVDNTNADGDLDVTDELTIEGNGATVAQTVGDRVLHLHAATVLRDLTVTGGAVSGDGGGVFVAAPATLDRMTITGNEAVNGGGLRVGATGDLTLRNSTIADNTADAGSGLAASGAVAVVSSTVSGNTASTSNGGAIRTNTGALVSLLFATVADNTGGNLRAPVAAVTVGGSIIADPATDGNCVGVVVSVGYNLASDGSCNLIGVGDQPGTDPLLGPLADNGGPTWTQAPASSSPAVDAIPAGTVALCDGAVPSDQRGVVRPQATSCDVGAVEATGGALVVDDGADARDATPGDGTCDDGTGRCTLRAAIDEANALGGPQTIVIDGSVPTVSLALSGTGENLNAAGDLDITDSATIVGNGATVDASGLASADRVVEIVGGIDVTLADLVITGGDATGSGGSGGGIRVAGNADVTLERVTVRGNSAPAAGGTGGGIAVQVGTLIVRDSTIADNTGAGQGGGIHAVGGGTIALTNATVTGNAAPTGGGIYVSSSSASLISSTVAGNGNDNIRLAPSGLLSLSGSIIADPTSGSDCNGGTRISNGFNIDSDGSCSLSDVGDQPSVDPLLGALADNGGPTETRPVGTGSPAIDAIPDGTATLCDGSLTTDQRGMPRPLGAGCDIGAVETLASVTVTGGGDTHDLVPGDGVCADGLGGCTLRAAVEETNAVAGAQTIVVDPSVPTVTLTLPAGGGGGELVVEDDLSIEGNGVVVDGNGAVTGARVFRLKDVTSHLADMTMTGGHGDFGGGVRVTLGGAAHLDRVTLAGNTASSAGGGLFVNTASVTITDSTIEGNQAGPGGGGALVAATGAPVTISNSTVTANTGPGGIRIVTGASLDLRASTVTGNEGNIVRAGALSMQLTGSIIANPASGQNCAGTMTSSGFNVASDATCGLVATGDQPNTDPQLGALAANGGPTETQRPAPTSPAIDAIPAGTGTLCDGTFAVDQRGVARPNGTGCDVGAVEYLSSVTVDDGGDTHDAAPGDDVCADGNGACTLRAAIDEANAVAGPQTITVDPSITAITLALPGNNENANASGDLDVTDETTIEGNGVTIDANGSVLHDRAIDVRSGGLTLRDATLTGGAPNALASRDGGALVANATTTLERVHLTGNTANYGGAVRMNAVTVTIIDSTIAQNTAVEGSGLTSAGGDVSLVGTTITANAGTAAAAVYLNPGSTASLVNTTVAANTSGGIAAVAVPVEVTLSTVTANGDGNLKGSGTYTMAGSVIGAAQTGPDCAATATIVSGGYNLDSDGTCALAGVGDQSTTPPGLAALADNGGPTETQLPALTSPVIDAIPPGTVGLCDGTVPTDQRGVGRPVGDGCDAGAVEAPDDRVVVDSAADSVDADPGDGFCADASNACTLRAAIMETNTLAGAQVIDVDPSITNVGLVLAGSGEDAAATGDLDVVDDLTIFGNGITVDAGGLATRDRVVDVDSAPGVVELHDLTLTGGAFGGSGD